MATPELTYEGAESAIRGRIRRSKLLTRVLAPVAVAAGIAIGSTGDRDAVAEAMVATTLAAGAAVFADSRLRERSCERIVKNYAEALGVPEENSRTMLAAINVDEEGRIKASHIVNDESLYMSQSREFKIVMGGTLGPALAASGVGGLALSVLHPEQAVPAPQSAAFLALGAYGLIARQQGLDQEPERYLQRLNNLDVAAMSVV